MYRWMKPALSFPSAYLQDRFPKESADIFLLCFQITFEEQEYESQQSIMLETIIKWNLKSSEPLPNKLVDGCQYTVVQNPMLWTVNSLYTENNILRVFTSFCITALMKWAVNLQSCMFLYYVQGSRCCGLSC